MPNTLLNLNIAGFAGTIPAVALVSALKGVHPGYTARGVWLLMAAFWLFVFGAVFAARSLSASKRWPALAASGCWIVGIELVAQGIGSAIISGGLANFFLLVLPITGVAIFLIRIHESFVGPLSARIKR